MAGKIIEIDIDYLKINFNGNSRCCSSNEAARKRCMRHDVDLTTSDVRLLSGIHVHSKCRTLNCGLNISLSDTGSPSCSSSVSVRTQHNHYTIFTESYVLPKHSRANHELYIPRVVEWATPMQTVNRRTLTVNDDRSDFDTLIFFTEEEIHFTVLLKHIVIWLLLLNG